MIGKIKYVEPNDQYQFQGQIAAEDGNTYFFNERNWLRRGLVLSDLSADQDVEFELKPPNNKGKVFPKNIRFAGESVTNQDSSPTFETRHSHGSFQRFVYIRSNAVIAAISKIIEEFNVEDHSDFYKALATSYNALNDADFIFSQDSDGSDIALVPSGLVSDDGTKILLYCVRHKDPEKSDWYCDRVFYKNRIVGGSVFELVNANWYDIESDIKELILDLDDSATDIIKQIEDRCIDRTSVIVALKDGQLASIEEANHLYVPTSYCDTFGNELYLRCAKRNGVRGYGWYYDCVTYENAPINVYSKKKWLDIWATFDENDVLADLANKTLEEKWSFGDRTDYGILRNYLMYTFAHQWESECISYSTDRRYAAFNTGLPDRNTYKYLYAFFERIDEGDQMSCHPLHYSAKYQFRDFVIQGRGGDGKLLSSKIRPLPDPPQYFMARSATVWELDFNASNQPTLPEYDDAHILIQRCDRLPLDFYRYSAMGSARLTGILDSQVDDSEKYKGIRTYFRPIIDSKCPSDMEVTQAYRRLKDALDNVIATAVKKLSWNWRAVVPCYNPEEKKPCFLLPVSFCDFSKPDRALIASSYEIDDEIIYQIHTVIPLDWAYLDARLVCRPESEWLATDCIN